MNTALYIVLGLFITFFIYFIFSWGMTSLFFSVCKQDIKTPRGIYISLSLAGFGVLTAIVGMVIFSSLNIFLFGFMLALMCFVAYFLILKYLWKFDYFDTAIIATTLAIILNPAWFRLIGIL